MPSCSSLTWSVTLSSARTILHAARVASAGGRADDSDKPAFRDMFAGYVEVNPRARGDSELSLVPLRTPHEPPFVTLRGGGEARCGWREGAGEMSCQVAVPLQSSHHDQSVSGCVILSIDTTPVCLLFPLF